MFSLNACLIFAQLHWSRLQRKKLKPASDRITDIWITLCKCDGGTYTVHGTQQNEKDGPTLELSNFMKTCISMMLPFFRSIVTTRSVSGSSRLLSSVVTSLPDSKFSIKGMAIEGRPAYLDFQATTPLDPRALDAMASHCGLFFSPAANNAFRYADALFSREIRQSPFEDAHLRLGNRGGDNGGAGGKSGCALIGYLLTIFF